MSLGLARACSLTEQFTVLYGELGPGDSTVWSHVWDSGNGVLSTKSFPIEMAMLDRLAVTDLVALQIDLGGAEELRADAPVPIDPFQVTLESAMTKRPMTEILQDKGIGVKNVGETLEAWVAGMACLLNVSPSINLIRYSNGKPQQETDVVFLREGVLHILDCKLGALPAEGKAIKHLHEAYSTLHRYGGLSTRYALIRPSMDFPKEAQTIVEGVKIKYVGPHACYRLGEAIAKFAQIDYTDEAREIDNRVERLLASGIPFYGKGGKAKPRVAKDPIAPVMELNTTLAEVLTDSVEAAIFDIKGLLIVVSPTAKGKQAKIDRILPSGSLRSTSTRPAMELRVAKVTESFNAKRIRDVLGSGQPKRTKPDPDTD